ncbi:replication initiation protein [uncultured Sulfuricurvum sp.]|uniref:replication initiation protein n=1 Tax=uncultured Sulfuricurvum sp. TaxID=430693 RepID=UPI00262D43BD|nr:replication initiation protein [uncultured Sulfuricurvum sp.]
MMIKKASGLIQMTNKLTRSQRAIYNYLLFVVKESLRTNPEQRRFEANVADIKQYTGAQNSAHIKESILQMQEVKVSFNVLGKSKKDWKKDIGLILDADTQEEGFVSFSMEEELIGAINHPDIYGLVDLKVIKGMQSKHSVALYEFISDYLKIGKKRVYLDDFKVLMGIDPQKGYKRFCDLNARVISPAIKEINEKTSIALAVEPIYRGRKVTALEFRFIYKDEAIHQKKQFSKKEQFVRYREEVYKTAGGRPIFVYKNRDVVVDKHPKKEKIMVGYKTPNGVEWYSDKEALTVWEILIQNKTAVDAKLWEYHCEDLRF